MIVHKEFDALCTGCRKPIILRAYKEFEGGLYGDHHCGERADLFARNPRAKGFRLLKERKK